MSSLSFKNQKYTKEEILQALKDIDKGQYKFSCKDAKATKYVLSYENKEYAIKQVCECLSLNRGIKISPQDHCDNEILRKRFIKMGFTIVAKYLNSSSQNNSNEEQEPSKQPLNQILYGPPGTGKTYDTIRYAVAAIENKSYDEIKKEDYIEVKKRYDDYKINGRIEFVTFHQSYSYEEFIEGIKPNVNSDDILKYQKQDGILKKISNDALFSRLSIVDDSMKKILDFEELKENFIQKNNVGTILKTKAQEAQFQIVNYTDSSIRIRPSNGKTAYSIFYRYVSKLLESNVSERINIKNVIPEVKGLSSYYMAIVEEFRNIKGQEQSLQFKHVEVASVPEEVKLKLVDEYYNKNIELKNIENSDNYVLIIDEINRGNISKIFGELITLIEDDKRETMTVTLPYSQDPFTVPKNLYIIGTMNTADKSLALLDVALRRRFEFKPMYPKYEILDKNGQNQVHYSGFLNKLNEKIFAKKKTADYLIGHSYFMDKNGKTPQLKDILNNCVIPLLMEYFNGKIDEVKTLIRAVDSKIEFDPNFAFESENEYYLQVKTVSNEW